MTATASGSASGSASATQSASASATAQPTQNYGAGGFGPVVAEMAVLAGVVGLGGAYLL